MCGGGGGGGSATTDALNKEQELSLKRQNMRTANDEWARQQAIAKINQLYGTGSTIDGETVIEHSPQEITTINQFGYPVKSMGDITFETQKQHEVYDASGQLAARNAGYDTVRNNALGIALDSLGKQKQDTDRELRFGLARSGLTGGSVDVDKNQNVADRYSEGIITANSNADGIVNSVKAKDEGARIDLISRINAGMDANSASSSALASIQNNQNAAKVEGQSNLLNNFFNGIMGGIGAYQYQTGAGSVKQPSNTYYNAPSTGGKLS